VLVWSGDRWWNATANTPRVGIGRLWMVSMIAVLFHVLMDLPTSYGTRPLSPFVWTWFAEDWEPIVDVYLLAILGAGLWFGRARFQKGRSPALARNAAVALTLMIVNYTVRGVAHHEAILRAPQVFGAQLPRPCDGAVPPHSPIERWPFDSPALAQGRPSNSPALAQGTPSNSPALTQGRPSNSPALAQGRPFDLAAPAANNSGRCLIEIAAMPDFVSPFRWRLIAHVSNAYEVRTVDLLSGAGSRKTTSDVRLVAIHYPNVWTPPVVTAARAPTAQVFLGFSRFPAARSIVAADGASTVRWTDLRFVSDLAPGIRERAGSLFGATIQVSPEGTILSERLGS
jgi:hypothetical protein